jgi:DNA mismatch repair protein MutS2
MAFSPGDLVHAAMLGKGIVRAVRNRGRYLVEIKGRAILVAGDELAALEPARPPRRRKAAIGEGNADKGSNGPTRSLDLHGKTVEEAIHALDGFLNTALLEGDASGLIIHGRSGGRIKAAVHARLSQTPSIRAFRVDPRNPGATIVQF